MVDGADITCAELIVAVCEVVVGQGVVTVSLEPFRVPDFVCHCFGVTRRARLSGIEKEGASGCEQVEGQGMDEQLAKLCREQERAIVQYLLCPTR